MTAHFADRLAHAVRTKGNALCVGLDPRWESLPAALRTKYAASGIDGHAAAYEEFCSRVLDIVAPLVPVVKPQAAFFEECGPAGLAAMGRLIGKAKQLGLLTILDAKRGDIASTATAYAEAAFDVWGADSITVNPYLGRDAIEPFLSVAREKHAGVFVLVRTSNPGAGLFQDLVARSPSGGPDLPLYQHVAEAVRAWTRENVGDSGFGDVGAVIGATYPAELKLLREKLPEVPFLIPGFGAQGGTAEDVKVGFRADGLGAIVNSSRGVLFPWKGDAPDWEAKIEAATRATAAALAVDSASLF
jgi:orotidine-5'-phosphate decarboxylase